jgi:hypothetical protein
MAMQHVIDDLDRLRTRSRTMLIAQRAAVVIAWALTAIAALIAFDYALRLPPGFRAVLLLAGVIALAWGVWTFLRPALNFRPTLTQLALRVERVMPAVAGRLASSVEFAAAGVDQNNPLADRAVRETQRRLTGESMGTVVKPARTRRDVGIMLAVIAGAAALVFFNPSAAATGLSRLFVPYGGAKWPARTGVESLMHNVVTLQDSGDGVFPRGESITLRAAVTRGEHDQRLNAHYRLHAGGAWQAWQRLLLTHQGGGVHERLIDTNAERLEVYFTSEDDETKVERIDLVPPPAVRRASLTVTPPGYAANHVPVYEAELGQGLDDRSITDTASLIGSEVALRLELNKPLPAPASDAGDAERARWIRDTFGWDSGAENDAGDVNQAATAASPAALPQFSADADAPTTWTLRWTLDATRRLPLTLRDEHGLSNSEPIQYRVEAVEDHVPAVTITQPQADEAVLPTAVIALQAEGRDDVALDNLALEAHVQGKGVEVQEALQAQAAWRHGEPATTAEAALNAEIELATLHVGKGDVVLVSAVAQDGYQGSDGARHAPVRSPVRRLRVMDETEFATQLRKQMSAVRQSAIRIEAQQAELQDDVIEDGVQPGMDRAQAQIGERIAAQKQAVQEVERLLRQNRLDDPQLAEILRQTQDLLDFAGRSAGQATQAIENQQQQREASGTQNQQGAQRQQGTQQSNDQEAQKPQQGAQQGNQTQQGAQQGNQAQQGRQQQQQQQPEQTGQEQQQPGDEQTSDAAHQPAPEDREIVEAQQEVRDELADLIKLLDRDEDTWVVKKQLENLAEAQAELEQDTRNLGQQTVGLKPEDLTERQRSDADRLAERQRDLTQQARDLIEQMRERSEAMKDIDPQAAESMRNAADTAEQQQLDRDMQQASQQIDQNQMTSAGASQQNAQRTMQRMQEQMEQSKRAQAQQLLRQLASLIESITRLISVQENELNSLALARDANNFGGLDRNMIRLNQNTQAVAGEARAAGQDARRVARSLDRAADAQGAAVSALRATPIIAATAEEAENRSLALLKEAKELAQALEKETAEQEVQRRREELMEQYRKFAERQVALRGETVDLQKAAAGAELDRRQLVEARRLASQQEELRQGLAALRDTTSEIIDAPVFAHVHRLIDAWSAEVSDLLTAGSVNIDATDRQQMIADAIGRLISAIEESMAPPPEFAQDQQQQPNGGGDQNGQQQQPLIPPAAQVKLLQGIQEQIYDLTKNIDSRGDLDDAQRRSRLRDLGQQQRDLGRLAEEMLESLKNQRPAPPQSPPPEQPQDPGDAGAGDQDGADEPQHQPMNSH